MAVSYNSNYDLTIPFSDVSYQVNVQTGTPESFTVPGVATDKYSAKFAYGPASNVFVRVGASPTVPASGVVLTESYAELNPGHDRSQRYLNGGDVVHFSTPDSNAYASVSLRRIQN